MYEAGYKVIAISDVHGGIHDPKGLDIPAALSYLKTTRSFDDYDGVEYYQDQLELQEQLARRAGGDHERPGDQQGDQLVRLMNVQVREQDGGLDQ